MSCRSPTRRLPAGLPEHLMPQRRDESRQKPPGHSLAGFPGTVNRTTKHFHRCHQIANGAWYFSSALAPGAGGRWDLSAPGGTCYLAQSPEGALMEAVGTDLADHGFVTSTFLAARQITELRLPSVTMTADLTAPTVSDHGVTSELTGAIPYTLTQQWAKAFMAAGFGGITYGLRFRPNAKGLGLFGPAGPADHPTWAATSALTIASALRLPIESTPALADLDVIEP